MRVLRRTKGRKTSLAEVGLPVDGLINVTQRFDFRRFGRITGSGAEGAAVVVV
jgi:hypothetical protein